MEGGAEKGGSEKCVGVRERDKYKLPLHVIILIICMAARDQKDMQILTTLFALPHAACHMAPFKFKRSFKTRPFAHSF